MHGSNISLESIDMSFVPTSICFYSLAAGTIFLINEILETLLPILALRSNSRVSPTFTQPGFGVSDTLSSARVVHGAKVNATKLLAHMRLDC